MIAMHTVKKGACQIEGFVCP